MHRFSKRCGAAGAFGRKMKEVVKRPTAVTVAAILHGFVGVLFFILAMSGGLITSPSSIVSKIIAIFLLFGIVYVFVKDAYDLWNLTGLSRASVLLNFLLSVSLLVILLFAVIWQSPNVSLALSLFILLGAPLLIASILLLTPSARKALKRGKRM